MHHIDFDSGSHYVLLRKSVGLSFVINAKRDANVMAT